MSYDTDKEHAAAITAAVIALNDATRRAFDAKLRIEVQVLELHELGQAYPWPTVTAGVFREV
jgi:hypothetical protein